MHDVIKQYMRPLTGYEIVQILHGINIFVTNVFAISANPINFFVNFLLDFRIGRELMYRDAEIIGNCVKSDIPRIETELSFYNSILCKVVSCLLTQRQEIWQIGKQRYPQSKQYCFCWHHLWAVIVLPSLPCLVRSHPF